jgi:hypothetical protein
LTQLSGRMVDLTKVYWNYTTFRRRTAWIPEVCSVGLAKAYRETDRVGEHAGPFFARCLGANIWKHLTVCPHFGQSVVRDFLKLLFYSILVILTVWFQSLKTG